MASAERRPAVAVRVPGWSRTRRGVRWRRGRSDGRTWSRTPASSRRRRTRRRPASRRSPRSSMRETSRIAPSIRWRSSRAGSARPGAASRAPPGTGIRSRSGGTGCRRSQLRCRSGLQEPPALSCPCLLGEPPSKRIRTIFRLPEASWPQSLRSLVNSRETRRPFNVRWDGRMPHERILPYPPENYCRPNARRIRAMPSHRPIPVDATSPSMIAMRPMSHSGHRSCQKAKSRLCNPLSSQRSRRLWR